MFHSEIKCKAGIEVFVFSQTFGTIALSITIMILILNALEISLLLKRYQNLSRFEILILNLAFADSIVGAIFLPVTSLWFYADKRFNEGKPIGVKQETMNKVTLYATIFGSVSSGLFLMVIGIERLLAVRTPLRQRIRNLSKGSVIKYLVAVWLLTVVFTGGAVLSDFLVNAQEEESEYIGSKDTAFVIGIVFLIFVTAIIGLYSAIAYSVLNRRSAFLVYHLNATDNRVTIADAIQKEKATIIACLLVVVSYLVCNIPCAVSLLKCKSEITITGTLLLIINPMVNPLIYFFKGYAERRFKERNRKNNRRNHSAEERRDASKKDEESCKTRNSESLEMRCTNHVIEE